METTQTERLHVTQQPGAKFKTTTVAIDFVEPFAQQNLEQRLLLAELMENYSARYPSKLAVARQLAELYGAQFGASVFRMGQQAVVRFLISFADEQYLPTSVDLSQQIAAFLREMIWHPWIVQGQFPERIFRLHQQNVVNYVRNLDDDKKYYVGRQLQRLYFTDDPALGQSIFGSVSRLEALSNAAVADYYQEMLTTNTVFVSALGSSAQAVVTALQPDLASLTGPTPRQLRFTPYEPAELQVGSERVAQQQSLYQQAYALPILRTDSAYPAAVVMNGLLGGTAVSLMFHDIRERESLVYYINSNYNALLGEVTIQSGIDGHHQARVQELIQQEIARLIDQTYSDEDLARVKQVLVSNFRSKDDSPRRLLNQQVLTAMFGTQTNADWETKLNQVSKAEISAVAQKLRLRASFFLKGDSDAETKLS
ncbi:insulinase family protein [Fructilactobacillus myrtifloralis]|uniref:Insulinase family protein n=1 Tax=Fructilactobacillus myrtifloralis TaxID=2940301 RepID=A0ABY5BNA9_9LACO|nr:insulinase family protein [Fructilactobacillus myrtifloralis]USS85168.1 insulinase family protein [Fructilactobacillus myrtifloralis]